MTATFVPLVEGQKVNCTGGYSGVAIPPWMFLGSSTLALHFDVTKWLSANTPGWRGAAQDGWAGLLFRDERDAFAFSMKWLSKSA